MHFSVLKKKKISVRSRSRLEPPFLAGAGTAFLPGACIDSGTSDVRSRPKKQGCRSRPFWLEAFFRLLCNQNFLTESELLYGIRTLLWFKDSLWNQNSFMESGIDYGIRTLILNEDSGENCSLEPENPTAPLRVTCGFEPGTADPAI